MLDQVFCKDAWYIDNSIPLSLHGIGNIREYWREHVLVQTDFSFGIMRVFECGPDIAFEWSARFTSPVHGGPVRFDGTIILTVDPVKQRVVRLIEYVNRLQR